MTSTGADPTRCHRCGGSGRRRGALHTTECFTCHGKGHLTAERALALNPHLVALRDRQR